MILEAILNALKSLIKSVFSWVDIPSMSDYGDGFETAVNFINQILETSQSLINLFLPWDIVRFGIPILLVVMNFEKLYQAVMWVLKKIPMLGIK